tara:strand:- start:57 stop:524 length:468 start_codon:yes stop_codon:yes gene_type:complete
MSLKLPHRNFTLTAKADRIDQRTDGTIDIVDYKTGLLPTAPQILSGRKPQLLIETIIALRGSYQKIPRKEVHALVSLRLNGGLPPGQRQSIEEEISPRAMEFLSWLGDLLLVFDSEDTPYYALPSGNLVARKNEYEHIARVAEWHTNVSSDRHQT